jgi:hypothetical protein
MDEPYEAQTVDWINEDYTGIYDGKYGPTPRAMQAAETPSGAFFRFTPPLKWEEIAKTSNNYFEENLDARVAVQHAKQEARKQSLERIKLLLQRIEDITVRDLCVFIGLLIASTIAPKKENFEHHWRTTDEDAIPRGCFNGFMKRTASLIFLRTCISAAISIHVR